jgi:hypothetical protein
MGEIAGLSTQTEINGHIAKMYWKQLRPAAFWKTSKNCDATQRAARASWLYKEY